MPSSCIQTSLVPGRRTPWTSIMLSAQLSDSTAVHWVAYMGSVGSSWINQNHNNINEANFRVWEWRAEANKTLAAALKSVMLGVAKHIPGCSSKTCNADRGIWVWIHYKGLGIRIGWSSVWNSAMPGNRYPKKLFNQEWNWKRRQRKCWSKVIDDLCSSLGRVVAWFKWGLLLEGLCEDSINEREII